MKENCTTSKKTDLFSEKKQRLNVEHFQPGAASLQKILQFASSYRVENVGQNQFVELFLN